MKEIIELRDHISNEIIKYPNSDRIINHLVQISGRADYSRIYRSLVQSELLKDSGLNTLVTQAGLLLSGEHPLLKEYIDKQLSQESELQDFDAMQFKYNLNKEFIGQLKVALSKQQKLSVNSQEGAVPESVERAKKIHRPELDQPLTSVSSSHAAQVVEPELVASQIEGTNKNPNKRALDTTFPASTESQVGKLKRQQTINLLLKLAQEDEDVAKKFKVAYGPEQYKQLQDILSTKQQVK